SINGEPLEIAQIFERMRVSACVPHFCHVPEGIDPRAVSIKRSGVDNKSCEISIGISPDLEAYVIHRRGSDAFSATQSCYDHMGELVNTCCLQPQAVGGNWDIGNEFYETGFRKINEGGSRKDITHYLPLFQTTDYNHNGFPIYQPPVNDWYEQYSRGYNAAIDSDSDSDYVPRHRKHHGHRGY